MSRRALAALLAAVGVVALASASRAQESRILSFQRDGSLTWTNAVTNGYSGFEFTEELPGSWGHAPLPFWNIRVTNWLMSVTIPIEEIQSGALFLRLASSPEPLLSGDIYDVDAKGVPQFMEADYIELEKIARLSRFRSGAGHDYSDDFESCRSMKHYFEPAGDVDWASIQIRAPVTGTVDRLETEWAGTQVRLQAREFPAFYFILFHVQLSTPLSVGDPIAAGQLLGTHIGNQTMSDIAVGVNTPRGWKLLSYFDVMADVLFDNYRLRGLGTRAEAIITQSARDADSLGCDGETFRDPGNLPNWITLQ